MSTINLLDVASSKSKKVPLLKGYSLMDWIRLTKSGTDLRGTGPKLLKVSYNELQKHNKFDDAWMSIRGRVYNVTKYMKYHPGGVDELLKGAGKDATSLFNDIHPWVNFESMLQACLIGELVYTEVSTFSHGLQVPTPVTSFKPPRSLKSNISLVVANNNHPGTSVISDSIQTSWSQTADNIFLLCDTSNCLVDEENIICDVHEDGLGLTVDMLCNNKQARLKASLINKVEPSLRINTMIPGKLFKIELVKARNKLAWNDIGSIDGNAFVEKQSLNLRYRLCRLLSKKFISHDTSIYQFRLPISCHMQVPVGRHVYFQINVDGVYVTRPYTVVNPDMKQECAKEDLNRDLYFIIKLYDEGVVSPVINNMNIGDEALISSYQGNFNLKSLETFQCVVFLCAGTGITPMLRIMNHCLFATDKFVQLLFFNKSEADILLKQDIGILEHKFSKRLTVEHFLSNPDSDWKGQIGRVTISCLTQNLRVSDSTYVCICGPSMFTDLCLQFMQQMSVAPSNLHAFIDSN